MQGGVVPDLSSWFSIAVGLTVIAGWAFDVPALRTFLPITNPMAPSTGGGFVLAGTALLLLRHPRADRGRLAAGRLAAGATAFLGLLVLARYAFGWNTGLERILVPAGASPSQGEMALPTAIVFVLLGTALFTLDVRTPSGGRPAQAIVVIAAVFPTLGLVGRLYGATAFSSLGGDYVPIALHTSVTFLVLCVGLLAARSASGAMATITGRGPGGHLVRRMLPLVGITMLTVGALRLVGERAGLYGAEFGEALITVIGLFIFSVLLWRTARSLDQSDRKTGEAVSRLQQSEKRQRALLESLGEAVVTTDERGRVTGANPATLRLLGSSRDDVLGRPYRDVFPLIGENERPIPPDDRPLARAMRDREIVATRGYDVSLVREDGHALPVSITAAPVVDDEGLVTGGIAVVRDVSLEREVDDMKSTLVSTVSHELRTPLTMIQGFAQLLEDRELEGDQLHEAARQINRSSERLARLIENLLTVSRIDSGQLEMDLEPLALSPLIAEAIREFAGGRHVEVLIPDDLPPVLADRDALIRILGNLISNAVKYSPAGGPVTVACSSNGSVAEIAITDRGIGMSDEEVRRLFEKFFRAQHPSTVSAPGTGLGLYITKSLVESLGGRISVRSAAGTGTTVTFTVPMTLLGGSPR